MTKHILAIVVLVSVVTSCRLTAAEQLVVVSDPQAAAVQPEQRESLSGEVRRARFDAAGDNAERLAQPPSVAVSPPEVLPPATPADVTIEQIVQVALSSNPSVAQANARVAALRGKWTQAGLPPNPSAGYTSSEVGNDRRGGQQGGFVGQEYVTGGKLRLDRAVVSQEIQQAEQRLYAAQMRVTTDVRKACYAVLVAQRRVALAEDLVRLSNQAVQASEELRKAEEIPLAGLLQTEVEQQNAAILLQTARNELNTSWQRLSAVVGSEMPPQQIAGDVSQLPALLNWDEQLVRVTAGSPELGAAMADILRAQSAYRRATVEPIPNVSTQAMVQYDESTNNTIAGIQVGIPLPLWNRNQGGIRQAQAEIVEAQRNADRVELNLKRRLAEAFQEYANARARAETYAATILPKAGETFALVQRGYQQGEVGYLDLLTAQRTYSQTNLAYLDALASLWASWTEIDGLLLAGSLESRPE